MKTRNGFVSNSSSSSFVVVLRDNGGVVPDVTQEQEQILLAYGFKYINDDWRNALTMGAEEHETKDGFDDKSPIAMTYDVICNEQDVMDFLFENHIPFVESEEYDTRTVCYDGKHDYYDTYINAGNHFLIYGLYDGRIDEMNKRHWAKSRPFYRTRISDGQDITDTLIEDEND